MNITIDIPALDKIAEATVRIAKAQEEIVALLNRIVHPPARSAHLTFSIEGGTKVGEITVADNETTLRFSLTPVDAEGHPTTIDTVPTYTSSDETVITIRDTADDGLSGHLDVGAPGDAVLTAANLGITDPDGNAVEGKGTVHVTPGGVATVSLDFAVGPEA